MRQRIDDHPPDEVLLLAGDRELPATRQTRVDAHVASCAACTERLRQMQSLLHDAGELYQSDFRVKRPPTHEARARLERALGDLSQSWERSWPTRIRRALATSHAWTVPVIAAPLAILTVWLSGPSAPSVAAGHGGISHAVALPVPALTPGAVSPLSARDLCRGARPSRRVSSATRDQVVASYRMQHVAADAYELDALITPELGGTADAENLWPQMYESAVWNARVKDELERLLPELVCRGGVDLARAQREIATDWIAAYKHYFKTAVPLQAHVGPPLDEDEELEFDTPYLVAQSLVHPSLGAPEGLRIKN